jgi:peptidoglycan/xylan/chitin deacetylase (PgdA/CDA1 family)
LAVAASLTLVVAWTASSAPPAAAAATTVVSLTFDDNAISQYNLGYLQALQPHGARATFFVKSGTVGGGAGSMTWAQLQGLAAAGNDIGGKSVSASNLTTDPNPSAQVCNDRATILSHSLTPVAFAYPGGAQNATVQGVVKGCGYGNARTAGGVAANGSQTETLPPNNWFATRAYAPPAVTFANLQTLVNGAVNGAGGWIQVVIGRICSSSLDAANYTSCSGASGHMELSDLNLFLDWIANAGQPGGAPQSASLKTVGAVVSGADTSAPITTIACNGAPCAATPYSGVVSVTLSATDLGSGMLVTRYTLDGSDPTTSSPGYTGAFNVNGGNSSTTVKFRSWDLAGNAEPTRTQVIQAPVDADPPTTSIACNGASCASAYVGSVTVSLAAVDTGGSGVAATYYTTDGTTPTATSTAYTSPFVLASPGVHDVKFFSVDRAGNAEQVRAQSIQISPVRTAVSLTFDNGTVGQYTLGYLGALEPHGATATFFVNSGNVGVSPAIMTWQQLRTLADAGNDIGGKTVNATNLTTDPDPTAQVCNDRAALVAHGLAPVSFAYPGGAFNATIEGIVRDCGYGTGRTAGSVSPGGPTYAETLPPRDWFATRAYAPTSRVTLANLKTLVTNAASSGGGWTQIVIGRVCSQSLDPSAYASCSTSAGWIELADLNDFLDWMRDAGQTGGAPAGAALSTVASTASSVDATKPVTTAACNGSPCTGSTYTQTVYVSLTATDSGSGVAATRYTLDGSDPTSSSPMYTRPIPVTATSTVKFRSWDLAGNVESTQSLAVHVDLPVDDTPPSTTLSCDGGPCSSPYHGSVTLELDATDAGGWGVDATYYTLDGTTPTTGSSVYTDPVTLDVPGAYTVRFFSVDLAGNAEQTRSQQIELQPPRTIVSLTFDDGDASQYHLAFQRGLQPRGMAATFYINTGNLGSGPGFMTWTSLTDMATNGQEIGGHTVHHIDLTSSSYTQQQKIGEVCNDRQALIDHGFSVSSFAYPFGAYDANAESIVQGCGFTSARRTGGIPLSGAPYSETIPPRDPYATITWTAPTPTTSPIALSDLQAAVTNAYANGGGWVQIVTHEVCSQTYDPNNYGSCMNSFRPMELATYNAFLDWLQDAGQQGAAPAGTIVRTVGTAINGTDVDAPVTTLLCDGNACDGSTRMGSTTLSFSATDGIGSGAKTTYYTTDGSTPTTSSTRFTLPFTIGAPTTIRFRSVDNAGNLEQVQQVAVNVQPNPDPVIGAAGDIACDPNQLAFNDGFGTPTDCRAMETAKLLTGVDAVLPLGDDQYQCGGLAAFRQSYATSWGVKDGIARPVPGDHDYYLSGAASGTDCPNTPGAGYFQYFGARAGDPSKGYYSYDLGTWHIVALNTAPCGFVDTTFCAPGSAQDLWLQQDLASHSNACTLAYYQNPRWASDGITDRGTYQQIWEDLYRSGVDVVLSGDAHWYERLSPLDDNGEVDQSYGIREFIVGTGGQGLATPAEQLSASEVLNNTTHGVIRLMLHDGSYGWTFVPVSDRTFTDSGSANCHDAPPAPDRTPPATTATCNGIACSSGWYQQDVTFALSATDSGSAGVGTTYYTTDGSLPTTASPIYTGPIPLTNTTSVRFFSVDRAGNREPNQSVAVQIDKAPPVTAIKCGPSDVGCSQSYTSSVQVSLSATDVGGSGVTATYYTTDGSTPSTSSPIYTGPVDVGATTTFHYFSVDVAGNTESPSSRTVTVNVTPQDTTAPITAVACNGGSCQNWFRSAVTITLSGSDAGGSGLNRTYYTLNGSTPTTSSTVYAGPFTVTSTTTVRFFSTDNAGNAEAVQTASAQIDTAAPTTTITCNNGSCTPWFSSGVAVRLAATDTGGSGVSITRYTTDGTNPQTSITALTYGGPFTVGSTATIRYTTTDVAGNQETARSQQVRLDMATPTVAITSPADNASFSRGSKVPIIASASDSGTAGQPASGITTVALYIDGQLKSTDRSSPWTYSWTTKKQDVGTHTLTAVATDAAGNVATSSAITVRIT